MNRIIVILKKYKSDYCIGLDESKKNKCGYKHTLTGLLLCPMEWDYDSNTQSVITLHWGNTHQLITRRIHADLKSGKLAPGPGEWCRFLYADFSEDYDSDDPIVGLFKSYFLFDICDRLFDFLSFE